jgi:glycosyltransferase involved in cell wall biosynthesis
MKRTDPDLIVESSALHPPLSGVGYYTRELLAAYGAIPDHFPVRILAYRFFLKPWRSPQEEYLAGLAASLGAALDLRRRPFPSLVYARLRRLGLRLPLPLDLFRSPRRTIFFFPNFVGEPLLRSRCVPVVYDFGYVHFPGRQRGRDHLFLKRYLPRTLRQAGQVIVISHCVKRELQDTYGVPPEKIAVVHPAVDHDAFRPDIPAERRLAVRKTYELNGEYLFSLSTLEPRKNFSRLLEAYALLPEGVRKRFQLIVAGGQGWKNEDIFATLRRLGLESRVKFLGYVPEEDRAPLMREAGLFVLPSLYEGFGIPVLEAMACGTPVVTSARGALPEVGGEAVVYADPLRPENIADGILSVLENPNFRQELSKAGAARAAAFQWTISARALADVFQRAAAESGE